MKQIKKVFKTIISVLASNRFKSFYWRSLMMFIAGFIDLIIASMADFNLPNGATIILGLILGEISKQLNANYQAKNNGNN